MNESVKTPLPPLSQSGIRLLWIAVLIFGLDQLTKYWVVSSMQLYETINVLPVFDIFRTFNEGAAWSFCDDCGGIQRWIFSGLAIVVSIGILVWLRTLSVAAKPMLTIGLTLILSGAIGNVVDRLRLGHVIDFLSVYWNNAKFPAFNVADAAITVGAVLVILDEVLRTYRERQAAKAAAAGAAAREPE